MFGFEAKDKNFSADIAESEMKAILEQHHIVLTE